jgi:hypothetical protein
MSSRAAGRAGRSERGSVAIIVALMLTMMIGFAALGTEVVFLLLKQRQMQAAASAAALGGATALMTGRPLDYTVEAKAAAANAGFVNGVASATVTINHPPSIGNYTSSSIAVEAIVSQPQTLLLAKLFFTGVWNVSARAVATEGVGASDCVLALGQGTAVSVGNGAQVMLNSCGLGSNSSSASAIQVTGGASLTSKTVSVVGNVSTSNGGSIATTNGVSTGQAAVADPYAGTAVPSVGACKHGTLPSAPLTLGYSAGTQVLSADGVYCGGLSIGNGAVVTMNPGVYIMDGGSFSVGGGSTLSGTGVTIVLTGTGSNYTTVSINNGVTVTLSAPTTGSTSGLVFFQDPAAPTNGSDSFQGGAGVSLTGALYFPSQTVTYANGANSTTTCTQLVADYLVFQGGASFNSNCANAGVTTIGGTPSELVE